MNLRKVRWILLAYIAIDFLIGYAGFIPISELAAAQFTTVTGTVTDPSGLAYANGVIIPTLTLPGGASPTLSGLPYTPPTQPIGLDANGKFSFNIADNTQLLPAATKWNFTVCSAAGTVQPAIGKGSVCFSLAAAITISGASQDISANLNAVAPSLSGATVPFVSTVGQGFLWIPVGSSTMVAAGTTATFVANHTAAIQMVIPYAITFTKVSLNTIATSNGNNYFIGIYSGDGNRLIRQATFLLGAGVGSISTTVPSTTLTAGVYWLMWGADNATATVTAWGNVLGSNFNVFNQNATRLGTSNLSISGGVLPSNIGTITPSGLNFPQVLLEP